MKYYIDETLKICEVVDEKVFLECHPDAKNISSLPNVYHLFMKQQKPDVDRLIAKMIQLSTEDVNKLRESCQKQIEKRYVVQVGE